jgi:hypothetical protein
METFVHRFLPVFFLFHLEESHKRSDGDALLMKFEFVTGVGKWRTKSIRTDLEENGEEDDSDSCGNKKRLTGDATGIDEEDQSEGDSST